MNVEAQMRDPGSILALTRALLELRRRQTSISLGDWAPLAVEGDVLAYMRSRHGRRFATVLNLQSEPKAIRFGKELGGRIVISTHPDRVDYRIQDHIDLGADEAVVIALRHAGNEGVTVVSPIRAA